MGQISVQTWPFALKLKGSSGFGLARGYFLATACARSGQEHPAFKIFGRGRKEGDAVAPLPFSLSLFITSSPQGGPVLKGNLAQSHGDGLWKGVPLLRHQTEHRKPDKSGDWEERRGGLF